MEEISCPILMVVAERSVSVDTTLQLMSKVSWDIREVKSMHNQYVDMLLRVMHTRLNFLINIPKICHFTQI